jgi:leucyl/phenylalanyl-tRNA--protein transferase
VASWWSDDEKSSDHRHLKVFFSTSSGMVFQLVNEIIFPDPALADEDGLLAVGGDLSVERLMAAYRLGIFPWYSEHEPVLWFSPHERFVLVPGEIKITDSMRRLINSSKYEVRWNTAFEELIRACSTITRKGQNSSWIHQDMIDAYTRLHENGIAHSVEIWQGNELVGGLYGLAIGKVFCGESMFSKQANTSKLALISLCQSGKYELIDCQVHTSHLEKMGAKFISRAAFVTKLR